jgi:hypothetical protein
VLLQLQNVWTAFALTCGRCARAYQRYHNLRLAPSKGPNRVGVSLSSPEDGSKSGFRNVVFYSFWNTWRWTSSRNPAIWKQKAHLCVQGALPIGLQAHQAALEGNVRFGRPVSHCYRADADRVRHLVSRLLNVGTVAYLLLNLGQGCTLLRRCVIWNYYTHKWRAICCPSPHFRIITKRRHSRNTFPCNPWYVKGRKGWGCDS